MKLLLVGFAMIGALVIPGNVLALEQTVTLAIENMTCSMCPMTVRKALEMQEGVSEANVSLEPPRAMVTFDDEHTDVQTLIAATTNAEFPSSVIQEGSSSHD